MAFARYAQYYDTIYKKKDYKKECTYLEQLFSRYSQNTVKTVLDLGCGTANHMIPLIEKGYKMTGIDASVQMLKIASQKLDHSNLKADLHRAKLQSFQLNRKFDATLCLFSVIDYVTSKKELVSVLKNIAKHMTKTSLFIFDFWNESAVNGYYSPERRNIFRINGKVLERSSTTKIYPSKRLCEVKYTCSLTQNGRLTRRDQERHVLRYFGIDEMQDYLKKAGLKAIDIHPFMNMNGKIKKNTWDVTMVSKKHN